ncbi:hypothetical protein ARALYDRAFT_920197 [Arabidopsis lyrata subsp. lyrata]|uniref:Uncharacterized protein n=1 Tax=Arabidopsis lyrata subsp. lyrata TaxID=81972 RepID=D7MWG1_ARALL|nr:hypothetical protein ARALYDRAFT_920197 [Arabidopsis lyrata subsp. lyrata]
MGEEEAVAEENGGLKVESGEQNSSWRTMRFDVSPYRTHHFSKQFRTARNPYNFLKGLKWSPDGSCFLASSEDNTLSLFHLPQDGGDSNGYGVPVPLFHVSLSKENAWCTTSTFAFCFNVCATC